MRRLAPRVSAHSERGGVGYLGTHGLFRAGLEGLDDVVGPLQAPGAVLRPVEGVPRALQGELDLCPASPALYELGVVYVDQMVFAQLLLARVLRVRLHPAGGVSSQSGEAGGKGDVGKRSNTGHAGMPHRGERRSSKSDGAVAILWSPSDGVLVGVPESDGGREKSDN